MRHRRRAEPAVPPARLLIFDAADWPTDDAEDARAWFDAAAEDWRAEHGCDFVTWLRLRTDARRAAAGLPPVQR